MRITLLLLFGFCTCCLGAEQIALYPGFGRVRVTQQAQFFADLTGEKSIQNIVNQPDSSWKPIPPQGFSKPFDAKPYWIKIPVRCLRSEVYFFQSTYVILEDFALYIHNKTNDSISYQGNLGLKHASVRNPFLQSSFVFRMPLEAQTDYDLYVRLNKRFSTTVIPFFLRDSANFASHVNQIETERGIIYGVFFILIFQGLVLLFYFKERLHFYYIGYVLSSFLILFISDGMFRFYFPSWLYDEVHFSIYFIIPICFTFVFTIVFSLLNTQKHFPELVRFSWVVIVFSFMLSVINAVGYFQFPNFPLWVFRLSNLFVILYPILFITICFKTYSRFKNRQALVLLFLFSLTLLFILFFALLPFFTYRHDTFSKFRWIILFEALALMLIINRDLYLNK